MKNLLRISLVINALFVMFFVGKRVYFTTYSYFHPTVLLKTNTALNDSMVTFTYNRTKADYQTNNFFSLLPKSAGDIVFIGNSLTAGFPLQEMFQDLHLKNRGIGGNTSIDLLNRLDNVTDGHPKKIFVEIGINDLSKGVTPDSLLKNVGAIVDNIKHHSKETRIYMQSVLPTALEQKHLVPMIEKYNKLLSNLCTTKHLDFINLYPRFYKNGGLDTSLTTDGVHLKGEGYFVWMEYIKDFVYN